MAEKRFKLAFEDFDGWAILDTTGEYSDDEDYIDWLSGQKAVDVMNHFAEENEQLRFDFKEMKGLLHSLDDEIEKLEKENEELKDKSYFKKEIERLRLQNKDLLKSNANLREENKELKTFKDKVFALIDARIEIYKHKPFMAPVSAPMSVNFDEDTDRLVRLSELEQLKEELSE